MSCVHVEMISRGKEHEDWPVVDRRDIKIDVWCRFHPEFLEKKQNYEDHDISFQTSPNSMKNLRFNMLSLMITREMYV